MSLCFTSACCSFATDPGFFVFCFFVIITESLSSLHANIADGVACRWI